MSDAAIKNQTDVEEPALLTYLGFLRRSLWLVTEGSLLYYAWMMALTAIALVGANAWAHQVADGMITTNMTDYVSWGLYIANFTFCEGLAVGGVLMVIAAYLYDDDDMHQVVFIGQAIAIAAIVMCTLFVTVDLGRPDRSWHLIPIIGKSNWPISMMTWDIVVLNGYLLLNLHIVGYLLYIRYRGKQPNPTWYIPFIYVSIGWAISIQTVTAFLYCGLGGRPFWNTALLAPRFLASTFVSGPAFIILVMRIMRVLGVYAAPPGPAQMLIRVIRIAMIINLIMMFSEFFTLFYAGGDHAVAGTYLFFGLHGHHALVPWIWTAVCCDILGTILFFLPGAMERGNIRIAACVLCIAGVWIEKGMGLIVPGFVPSTLHQLVEYLPSLSEWKVSTGIWAFGLMLITASLKLIINVLTGRLHQRPSRTRRRPPRSWLTQRLSR
ncbi:MAG: NrfD/PsrC family molybdoenzyme membrane anchor subunit [Pirellulaceae bacterium]|nr:polysulfide reductase NrfD [Planctomycetales bacterium]